MTARNLTAALAGAIILALMPAVAMRRVHVVSRTNIVVLRMNKMTTDISTLLSFHSSTDFSSA